MSDRLLDVPDAVAPQGHVDPLPHAPASLPDPLTEPVTAPAQVAAVPPPTVVPDIVVDVVCPTCGTPARVNTTRRDAEGFCVTCDHPLFWAVERPPSVALDTSDTSLRRLPGTAGRASLSFVDCRNCREPNAPANTHCSRCGIVLAAPVVVPGPEPAPTQLVEVMAVVEQDRWWLWLLALAALGLVVLAVVLVSAHRMS